MNEPFLLFLGTFAGLTIGFPLLALYCWVLFRYGERIAENYFGRISRNHLIAIVCLAWIPVSALAFLMPVSDFVKFTVWVILYLFHCYPTVIGLVYRYESLMVQETRRFQKNVDDWLSQWECHPDDDEEVTDWDELLNANPDDPQDS